MFRRCFIISSFNLATLQQFFKKRQNRRYYHFKSFGRKLDRLFHLVPKDTTVLTAFHKRAKLKV